VGFFANFRIWQTCTVCLRIFPTARYPAGSLLSGRVGREFSDRTGMMSLITDSRLFMALEKLIFDKFLGIMSGKIKIECSTKWNTHATRRNCQKIFYFLTLGG
jgi:hypothetical protein